MTIRNKKGYWVLLLLLISQGILLGQISISNLMEYQRGNLPHTDPKSLSTLYDQVNVNYHINMFHVFTKIEAFKGADKSKSYAKFIQKGIGIEYQDLAVTIGNYYHIIGRGLLLRSYEIPGTVLEDIASRTRYGFYRDVEGALASYKTDTAEFYFFYGRPLNNLFPPTFSDDLRRSHLVKGIDSRIYIDKVTLSGSYLRDNYANSFKEYSSLAFEAVLPHDLQLYTEYAQQYGEDNKVLDMSQNTAHAFYIGTNWFYDTFGLSYEYKSYNKFLLGYNDPPPLVKEHQYLLLNRSTHRIIPANETGWQVELFYRLDNGNAVNLNASESVNKLSGRRYIFNEQFIEFNYYLSEVTNVKAFFDHSIETLFAIDRRYTLGTNFETELTGLWSLSIDLEYQQFKQTVFNDKMIKNYATLLSVSNAPDLSFGFIIEKSNDPADLPEGKKEDYWISGNITYQLSQMHLISLFMGKRRGGNACTSGICYEILPFEGVELRLTSHL